MKDGCTVQIQRLTVQPDNTTPREEGDEEVEWWKRLKARIEAREQDERGVFEAVLDLRARVLRFMAKEPRVLAVDDLALGVVREMASFSTLPTSRFLQRRDQPTAGQSVWLASDAELVSGLFHQVKEQGEFALRPRAPLTPALGAVLGDLLISIDANLAASFEWTQGDNTNPLLNVGFDVSAWEAHKHIVLRDLDDPEARRTLVAFYEQTASYADLIRQAKAQLAAEHGAETAAAQGSLARVDPTPFTEQARLGIRHDSHRYQQMALRFGREYADYAAPHQLERMSYLGG